MPLLTREHVTLSPIESGDAGIILKPDGSFRVFNTHTDIDPLNVTDAQKEQTKKLLALAVALKVPQVMAILEDCASDPEIAGTVLDLGKLDG